MALDFEVVHWGHPTFDTAFWLTHLTLKAAHRPALAPAYGNAARIVLSAYTATLHRSSAYGLVFVRWRQRR
jgi:hypothetical protein